MIGREEEEGTNFPHQSSRSSPSTIPSHYRRIFVRRCSARCSVLRCKHHDVDALPTSTSFPPREQRDGRGWERASETRGWSDGGRVWGGRVRREAEWRIPQRLFNGVAREESCRTKPTTLPYAYERRPHRQTPTLPVGIFLRVSLHSGLYFANGKVPRAPITSFRRRPHWRELLQ